MLPRVTALIAGLSVCALAQAAPTQYPLTLQNCGSTLTFQHAPARSVTIGQAATEMLYALGVGDKVPANVVLAGSDRVAESSSSRG